jgi:hypothetical protein
MPKPEKLGDEIIRLMKVAIIAMIAIYVVYKIADVLIGQLPAKIGIVIIGIAMAFVYSTSAKVRKTIRNRLK